MTQEWQLAKHLQAKGWQMENGMVSAPIGWAQTALTDAENVKLLQQRVEMLEAQRDALLEAAEASLRGRFSWDDRVVALRAAIAKAKGGE
jgi:hypothetical protein